MNIAGVDFAITVFVDKDLKGPAKRRAYKGANDNRGNCEMHFDGDSMGENVTGDVRLAMKGDIFCDIGSSGFLFIEASLYFEKKRCRRTSALRSETKQPHLECRSAALRLVAVQNH